MSTSPTEMIRRAQDRSRPRPRGTGRLQGRRRRRPPLRGRVLRPRRPAQHAAVLRRDRPRPAPGRVRGRRRELGRGDALLHAGRGARARLPQARASSEVETGGAADGHLLRRPPRRLSRAATRFTGSATDRSHLAARQPALGRRADAEAAARGRARARRPRRSSTASCAPRASSTVSRRRCSAAEAGEVPVVMSGDGLIGAVGGALAGTETPLGIIPGGRGNDLARVLGIPDGARRARSAVLAAGARRAGSTSARSTAGASSASPAAASTPTPTGSPTRRKLVQRQPRLRLRGAARAGRLEAGPFTVTVDGERHPSSPATRSRSPTARPSAAACSSPPTPSSTTAMLDVVTVGDVGKLRFLGNLPKVFKGTHVENDEVARLPRGATVEIERRPRLRRLRRRRAPHRPAGDAARPAAARCSVIAPGRPAPSLSGPTCGARRAPVRRQARPRPGGRGAEPRAAAAAAARPCPAGCCCAWRPDAIDRLGAGLDGGSTVVSATNGKTTTAGMIAAILRGRRPRARSTTAPART